MQLPHRVALLPYADILKFIQPVEVSARITHWFGIFEGERLKGVCGYGHFTRGSDGAARKYFGDLELVHLEGQLLDILIRGTLTWMRRNTKTF